jgi:2-keto-4-pentenoate hydratase
MHNIENWALRLIEAQKKRQAINSLTDVWAELDVDTAYQIQRKIVEIKSKAGQKIRGYKIGFTNKDMQSMVGVLEPDFGHIMDAMIVDEALPISLSSLIQPKVEGEIAFIIKDRLSGPGVTVSDVLVATAGIMPAIEIIDSRIRDWNKIQDTIADNGSAAFVILGGRLVSIDSLDTRLVGMLMDKDGEIVGTGAGAVVMGNPVAAVAWLANKLAKYSLSLEPGMIVLSGSVSQAIPVQAPTAIKVHFDRLGAVKVKFE